MTVVFYISGHGFGHASRDVEILNALGAARPDLRLVLRTAASPALLARTLTVPHTLRPGPCDTGIVQRNSVTHDDAATVAGAVAFYRAFDAHVARDVEALSDLDVRLVVADIAPLGLAVARRLAVPSIFIGNFTWDWIYDGYDGLRTAAPDVLATIREAHASATMALRLPLSPSFEGTGLPPAREIPLIARRPTRTREDTRRHFGLPLHRRLALLSFGGYGLNELDLSTLDCLDDWDIVGTDRSVSVAAGTIRGVHGLAESQLQSTRVRYEDLVAACDAVISKPGFGIIGECATAGVPLLYTSRGAFREYDVLVDEMPRILRCRFISQADMFAGRWRAALDALVAQPAPPEHWRADGADVAARHITALL